MQSLKLPLYCLAILCLALVACEDIDKASAPAEKSENAAQAAEVNVPDAGVENIAPATPTADSPNGENKAADIASPQLDIKVKPSALKLDSSAFKIGSGSIKLEAGVKTQKPE
jgi:hypothetical protein